jgi:AraC-like DNA-binding protein
MKPRLEQLSHLANQQSFLCYQFTVPSFELIWHYHPEFELTYILKGKGKRLVGDEYRAFTDGDLVLLPPMIPHTWISDQPCTEECSAIVIQFPAAFLEQLLSFPEMKPLEKLTGKTGRGLQFAAQGRDEVRRLLQQMPGAGELTRFSLLLQVLQKLSDRKSQPIASLSYKPVKPKETQQRISRVFDYVQKKFRESVSLEKAAALVHLSESAFCKFFKRTSGRTFSDYVNEIRIGHACQLLMETDLPVHAIADASGFESLTYFNRVFLRKKKMTPGQFRKL